MSGPKRRTGVLGTLAVVGIFAVPALAVTLSSAPGGIDQAAAATVRAYAANANESLIAAGQVIYLQTCASCHGPLAQGTDQGPPIIGLGPANLSFQMSTGRMPLAEPGAQGIRRPPVLTPAQIEAVIAYVDSLQPGGTPIPKVDPAAGSLSAGSSLYLSNCAPCHSSSGNGGAVGAQVAPGLHQATATQIAEAIRIGPGTMPVFDERVISQTELNSLTRYVLYLRHPTNEAGVDLGEYGPIVEGFVALFVALAVMIIVTRYIGARS
jgi:ubiquinol-cytochrome c reductase cytochrome c subunit